MIVVGEWKFPSMTLLPTPDKSSYKSYLVFERWGGVFWGSLSLYYLVRLTLLAAVICVELHIFGGKIYVKFLIQEPNRILCASRQYGTILMVRSNIIKETL